MGLIGESMRSEGDNNRDNGGNFGQCLSSPISDALTCSMSFIDDSHCMVNGLLDLSSLEENQTHVEVENCCKYRIYVLSFPIIIVPGNGVVEVTAF